LFETFVKMESLIVRHALFFLTSFILFLSPGFQINAYPNKVLANWPTLDGAPTKLFGHGGEKFYLPEHTVGSYELAAIEGYT